MYTGTIFVDHKNRCLISKWVWYMYYSKTMSANHKFAFEVLCGMSHTSPHEWEKNLRRDNKQQSIIQSLRIPLSNFIMDVFWWIKDQGFTFLWFTVIINWIGIVNACIVIIIKALKTYYHWFIFRSKILHSYGAVAILPVKSYRI